MALATLDDSVVNVERVESGELPTVLDRLIPVDIADDINPDTGFDPVKTTVEIDRIKGVTVGEGVITIERVESGELVAVLVRLTVVEVALGWTAAVGVLKPEEPVEVTSGIDVEVMLDLTEPVDPLD